VFDLARLNVWDCAKCTRATSLSFTRGTSRCTWATRPTPAACISESLSLNAMRMGLMRRGGGWGASGSVCGLVV
jgi:hypothetical protein